jgi:hypothetical protein
LDVEGPVSVAVSEVSGHWRRHTGGKSFAMLVSR